MSLDSGFLEACAGPSSGTSGQIPILCAARERIIRSMSLWFSARALGLLMAANVLPWVVGRVCGSHWDAPLDFGVRLKDDRRLLGSHKTWRGVAAAVTGCAIAAELVQLHWWLGAEFGALSMLGDSLSSAWKRHRGHAPGREVFGLDQLPEALLPLTLLRASLGMGWAELALVVAVFAALDVAGTSVRNPPSPQPRSP